MKRKKIFYSLIKRTFDIFLSFFLILFLLPLFLVLVILVSSTSKGGPFFIQERIGKKGKIFKLLKFRSMYLGAEKEGVYSDDNDSRVTKVGKFLRKTSLDELPQLFNIFIGNMSFVGPRPVLTYHPWPFNEYSNRQLIMFEVRPGITGWAQINGRKTTEWHERIELNVWYVLHRSILLDLKILFKTVRKVIKNSDNQNIGSSLKERQCIELMYITNKPEVIRIVDENNVNRVFIDMEYIGKDTRQKGLNTVKNHHTIVDVKIARSIIKKAELLVRINPIHKNSSDEIEKTIKAGADVIMLPMFKTTEEVKFFINQINKRCKTCLLLETKEAVEILDDILEIKGIDEIHIGLNDLHLSYGLNFMFELLSNGVVDYIINKIKAKHLKYGFGGISRLGNGIIPAEIIIAEHYRLGSSMAILSRSFCDSDKESIDNIKSIFNTEISNIRNYEESIKKHGDRFFEENHKKLRQLVEEYIKEKKPNE